METATLPPLEQVTEEEIRAIYPNTLIRIAMKNFRCENLFCGKEIKKGEKYLQSPYKSKCCSQDCYEMMSEQR